MRIAVGGFQHETNTFAPTKAELRYFEEAEAWPGLVRGSALPGAVAGINLPEAREGDCSRLGQVTRAYQKALEHSSIGAKLSLVFRAAIRASNRRSL